MDYCFDGLKHGHDRACVDELSAISMEKEKIRCYMLLEKKMHNGSMS